MNISPLAILQSRPDQKPSQPQTVMWWNCVKSLLNGLSVLDSLQALTTLVEVLVRGSHFLHHVSAVDVVLQSTPSSRGLPGGHQLRFQADKPT